MIDPFKILGKPSTWKPHGAGEHDADCEAERRAWIDFFLRRLTKGGKRKKEGVGGNILMGGSVAMASVFISAEGGPDAVPADAFDRWIAIQTFAWYQALAHDAGQA